MPTNHSCIAELLTSHLLPKVHSHDLNRESSMARARDAEMQAYSLRRLCGNLLRRMVGRAPVLTDEQQLAVAIRRLEDLSSHLLADVGIDATSGTLFDAELTLQDQAAIPEAMPVLVAPVRQPVRARSEAADIGLALRA